MTMTERASETTWGVKVLEDLREARRAHQDRSAADRHKWISANRYFYGRIKKLLQFIIEPGKRVLDVRCLTGDMLEALNPSRGVGIEIGREMVEIARRLHPEMTFAQSDAETLDLGEKFDYVLF